MIDEKSESKSRAGTYISIAIGGALDSPAMGIGLGAAVGTALGVGLASEKG